MHPRFALVLLLGVAACGAPSMPAPNEERTAAASSSPTPAATSSATAAPNAARQGGIDPTQFDSTDLVVGSGPEVELGSRVSVQYVGKLMDGTVFDETQRRPFEFTVGQGDVIAGWDRGVVHMRVGGKRRLVIPPDLAYGARGVPPKIPANATLVFDIELVAIEP